MKTKHTGVELDELDAPPADPWQAINQVLRRLPAGPEALHAAALDAQQQATQLAGASSVRDAAAHIEYLLRRNAELQWTVDMLRASLAALDLVTAETRRSRPTGDSAAADTSGQRPIEELCVWVTHDGFVGSATRSATRRSNVDTARAQQADEAPPSWRLECWSDWWILFFTNKGRVYRARAFQIPDAGGNVREWQRAASLLAFQPDETISQVLAARDYEAADYLVLATRKGMVKKTRLSEYDSNHQGGIIAINLADDDELISARLVSETDDLLMVSRKGMSARFTADDDTLRLMGRATSGVIGMRFRGDDSLLAMDVVRPDTYVVTVTDGGYAKRTPMDEWVSKGRGILGVRAMRLPGEQGALVGAMVCDENDHLFMINSNGVVIRTRVGEIRLSGRDTMGVSLMNLGEGVLVSSVLRQPEVVDGESVPEAHSSPGA